MNNSEQPIYPLPSDVDSSKVECAGLTKREYFAGLAMQGCIASGFQTTIEKHVESAVEFADALLKELSKTK